MRVKFCSEMGVEEARWVTGMILFSMVEGPMNFYRAVTDGNHRWRAKPFLQVLTVEWVNDWCQHCPFFCGEPVGGGCELQSLSISRNQWSIDGTDEGSPDQGNRGGW